MLKNFTLDWCSPNSRTPQFSIQPTNRRQWNGCILPAAATASCCGAAELVLCKMAARVAKLWTGANESSRFLHDSIDIIVTIIWFLSNYFAFITEKGSAPCSVFRFFPSLAQLSSTSTSTKPTTGSETHHSFTRSIMFGRDLQGDDESIWWMTDLLSWSAS